jgi:hypothetical protein
MKGVTWKVEINFLKDIKTPQACPSAARESQINTIAQGTFPTRRFPLRLF